LENVYEELKALGTFTDYDAKPSADPLPPKTASTGRAAPDPRFEYLEGKVQLLDDKINALKDRIDFLSDKRIERDDIVIELLTMLKTNLDSRNDLIAKLNLPDNDNSVSDDADHSGDNKPGSSAKVSSLEKHKQKKN
jgi:hypothetical protein